MSKYTGWTNTGGGAYQAAIDTSPSLPPGLYGTVSTNSGLFFVKGEESDRTILRFPDAPITEIVEEIEMFWERGDRFSAHGLPHKRGILMHGPPGSGKSCTVQLLARDVIERGGLVLLFSSSFSSAYRTLREVEPERPIVVLMEDLDSIIRPANESDILNVLDGIGNMHHVVFVATTNYPENLGERITNRPSRFDRKVFVGHPSAAARAMYFESLLLEDDEFPLAQAVRDTEGLSLAHLKELFVATVILDNRYEEALADLKKMKEKAHSLDSDTKVKTGFGNYA